MKRDDCTPQEQWVLEQVEKGEIADLMEQFGEAEEKRRLRAKFLEALLTDDITINSEKKFRPHRKGIRIAQAIIHGAVDLENAQVGHIVSLVKCFFKENVNFRDARFKRLLLLNGSYFEKELDCHRLWVKINIFCRRTTFRGRVNFGGADIGGQFYAERAHFQGMGQKNEVNFNGLKVGQIAFFSEAVFQGPVDFVNADIGGQFNAEGAQFLYEKKVSFNSLNVGQDAYFRGALFQGPVDFRAMVVKKTLHLNPLLHLATPEEPDADRTYLTIFHRGANFSGSEIRRQLGAHNLRFISESELGDFNGLKVGEDAFFDNAVFQGPVDFSGADIKGQFNAQGAQFLSPIQATFEGIKVGQSGLLGGATFNGPVALNDAHLLDLLIGGNPILELNLERTRFDRTLLIGQAFIKKITARNLTVKGLAALVKVTITTEADLRDTSFQQLNIVEVTWPIRAEGKARVWLDGMDFKTLSTKREPQEEEDWNKVLEWLSLARFNTQNYNKVDEYFQHCGLDLWAYKVFREGKKRGFRGPKWRELNWWSRLISPLKVIGKFITRVFWGWLAGYGRKPARTLGLIIPLIFFGALLFEPKFTDKFLATQSAFKSIIMDYKWIARGILSLDRFLPGVDLGLAKHWQPCYLGLGIWLYWYVLKIMGWILIPITLAAIYTKIK